MRHFNLDYTLGEYLVNFDMAADSETDLLQQTAEAYIENARSRIAEAELAVKCNPAPKDDQWALVLTGDIPTLEGIDTAFAWPITVTSNYAVDILDNHVRGGYRLGAFSESSVTGLIAFEVKVKQPDVTARFVLNLPVTGLPEGRNSAIMRTVISNQDGFIRYLLLLLGDDKVTGPEQSSNSGFAKWLAQLARGEDIPLLEELTRTYSRYPERLAEISDLVHDLSQGPQETVIPEDFLDLWSVFESAIGRRHDA